MPLAKNSDLQTVSFVLAADQVERIRALQTLRSTRHARASFSAIAREVVETGLATIYRAPDTTFERTIDSAKVPV